MFTGVTGVDRKWWGISLRMTSNTLNFGQSTHLERNDPGLIEARDACYRLNQRMCALKGWRGNDFTDLEMVKAFNANFVYQVNQKLSSTKHLSSLVPVEGMVYIRLPARLVLTRLKSLIQGKSLGCDKIRVIILKQRSEVVRYPQDSRQQ